MHVLALTELFGLAEVIEIEYDKCTAACASQREPETALPKRNARPAHQLALSGKHKR